MRKGVLLLIARQFLANVFKSKAIYLLIGMMVILLFYAALSGKGYHDQNHFRTEHQEIARKSWEDNPDKHPHRMAHFGTFAFRLKHALSVFDFGIESFTGNAVFLEAHRQNMVNFSEASFSTGLLRFGELSMAMILQTILPLLIFFIGYASIVSDRANGTLKILLTQGASWKEILLGRSLGLFIIACIFILPYLLTLATLLFSEWHDSGGEEWTRFALVTFFYLLYAIILCFVTIIVSAQSQLAKNALVKLLGIWLLLVVLLPKTSQAIGSYFYPSPTKLTFRSAIEEEVIQNGDSHNPNDPFFNSLRDSVLNVHQVKSVEELPFNYGGFIMGQGEKLSAKIYNKHHNRLLINYRNQNSLTNWLSIINPYLALKNISMTLCGTDFESYVDFQKQSENYRYLLAQKMNELQMKYISTGHISGSEGKVHVVNRSEWKAFPDFDYHYPTVVSGLRNEIPSLLSVLGWFLLSILFLFRLSKKAKAL
ncbi:MAG: DUF3526 domain-containing protein [Bacteroidota bacterium]